MIRFKQSDPVLVNKWLTEEAKTANAEIFFGDEASVSSTYNLGKTIEKRGETPIVTRTSKRFKVNMLSAVRPQGECRFMITEKSGNSDVFIEFLKRLMKGVKTLYF